MAGRQQTTRNGGGSGQRLASLAVLALLCAIVAWMLAVRPQLNPAVEVSLRAPAPKAGVATASGVAGGAAAATEAAATPDAPGVKTASLASLLPDAAPGSKPLAPAESFTPATLSDKIDGKAEMYLAAGFAAMSCRSYQAQTNPPARVELYLYRMKSSDAAFAVFSGQRRPGAAQSTLAKNAYLTDNALFLTSGAHYLEVIADRAGMRTALEGLAKAVLANVSASEPAGETKAVAELQPADLFPRVGLKPDSLRLAVADAFGCQGLTNVYIAEYTVAGAEAGAFLSRRKNPAEAQAQMALYQRFLTDNGFALQTAPGAPAGAVILALEGMGVELLFTRGPVLAGVHEAPNLDAALKLAVALDAALKAKGPAKESGK